jgi:anti-anti-sigma factor
MHIEEIRREAELVVVPVGRVDVTNASTFQSHLVRLVARGERRLVLDLSRVDYISSVGLRAVETCADRVREVNGELVLCGLTEPVRLVFDLAGLLSSFTIQESCGTPDVPENRSAD